MYLDIPIMNPFNFVDKNRELQPQYNFKHFDPWKSNEQILAFDTYKFYKQPWQNDDIAFLQVESDFTPIRVQIRNSRKLVVLSQEMSIVGTIGNRIFLQSQIAFDFFPEGCYTCEILAGDPVLITAVSEPFEVLQEQPGTLLLKFSNLFNNAIMWEWRGYMTYRVNGVIPYEAPASVRTVYLDQPLNAQTVKGDAARLFKLYIGCNGGMPPYIVDKLDEILDQNTVEYDGKGFAPAVGAAWNTNKIYRYPWAQWNIEMRETNNKRYKRFEVTGLQEKKVVIEYIVSAKLFGPEDGSANDNTFTINEIE